MDEKRDRIKMIEEKIHDFCRKYLNEEYEGYALKLCGKLGRKRIIDINRGRSEIWAASIVYVIARLNFLFDKMNVNYITVETISKFFNTKKSTIGNKATHIMDMCNLGIGAAGYSKKAISDMFTFYQTPEGFVFPKSMLKEHDVLVDFIEGEETEKLKRHFEEQERIKIQKQQEKKARLNEIRKKKAEEEEKSRDAQQLSLFD